MTNTLFQDFQERRAAQRQFDKLFRENETETPMTESTTDPDVKITDERLAPCCEHYLTECNLCQQMSYCEHHGCVVCNLKHADNFQALSATPDAERKVLIDISQRPLPKRKATKKRRKFANKRNYREAWLDDLIALNKEDR